MRLICWNAFVTLFCLCCAQNTKRVLKEISGNVHPFYLFDAYYNLIVPEGEPVHFACSWYSNSPKQTLWYKNGILLNDVLASSLRINSVSRKDSGVYTCHVRNQCGELRGQSSVLIVGYMDTSLLTSARKHIEVRRGHALVLWPWTYRTEENDGNTIGDQSQRTVSSKSFSVPPPQARWTMNNAPVIISRSVYISLISQALILLNVDNDVHSQIFRASLSNGYRSSDENTAAYSQIHIIQVTELQPSRSTHSLEIILAPKDVKLLILEGQESKATFECIFNARPANALRVQWFRRIFSTKHSEIRLLDTRDNHSSCDQGVRRHKFDKSGLNRSITISKVVQASSDFQEEYICKALLETTNEDQFAASKDRFFTGLSTGGMPFKESMSATARLWIISPPRLGFPRQMIPMEVWIKNGRPRAANIQGVVSSKQVLTCMYEYTGQPKATMSWLKNAQVLKNDGSRVYVDNHDSLIIRNLTTKDAGAYQCHAKNEAGEDLLAIWLNVISSPPRVHQSSASNSNAQTVEHLNVTLECPSDAEARSTFERLNVKQRPSLCHQNWWVTALLVTLASLTIISLLLIIRENIRRKLCKSQVPLQQPQDNTADCCLLDNWCVDEICTRNLELLMEFASCYPGMQRIAKYHGTVESPKDISAHRKLLTTRIEVERNSTAVSPVDQSSY